MSLSPPQQRASSCARGKRSGLRKTAIAVAVAMAAAAAEGLRNSSSRVLTLLRSRLATIITDIINNNNINNISDNNNINNISDNNIVVLIINLWSDSPS